MNFAFTLESWKVEQKYTKQKRNSSDIDVDFGFRE